MVRAIPELRSLLRNRLDVVTPLAFGLLLEQLLDALRENSGSRLLDRADSGGDLGFETRLAQDALRDRLPA
jgi:hypothetical protein